MKNLVLAFGLAWVAAIAHADPSDDTYKICECIRTASPTKQMVLQLQGIDARTNAVLWTSDLEKFLCTDSSGDECAGAIRRCVYQLEHRPTCQQ